MNPMKLIPLIILSIVLVSGSSALAAPPIVDGDFDDAFNPSTNWTVRGNVTIQTDEANNNVALFAENGSGGLSSLSQTFTLPAAAKWISFRYYLYGSNNSTIAVPPDSFTAYLLKTTDNSRLVEPSADPTFTRAILYEDTRGKLYHPSSNFVREDLDAAGYYRVRIPVTGITSQSVKIQFAFNNAENESDSFAILDDVAVDCPAGYCCDLASGEFQVLDDGNGCTNDICTSGVVSHESYTCCGQCDALTDTPASLELVSKLS